MPFFLQRVPRRRLITFLEGVAAGERDMRCGT